MYRHRKQQTIRRSKKVDERVLVLTHEHLRTTKSAYNGTQGNMLLFQCLATFHLTYVLLFFRFPLLHFLMLPTVRFNNFLSVTRMFNFFLQTNYRNHRKEQNYIYEQRLTSIQTDHFLLYYCNSFHFRVTQPRFITVTLHYFCLHTIVTGVSFR